MLIDCIDQLFDVKHHFQLYWLHLGGKFLLVEKARLEVVEPTYGKKTGNTNQSKLEINAPECGDFKLTTSVLTV